MSVYGWTTADQRLPVAPPQPKLVSSTVVGAPASLSVADGPDPYTGSVTRSKTIFNWETTDALAVSYIVQLNGVEYAPTVTNQYVFTNLKPGDYTFGVIAVNAAGARSGLVTAPHTVTTPSGTLPSLVLADEGTTPGQPSKRLALIDGELVTVEV